MKTHLPPPPDSYRRLHQRVGPTVHKLHLSCGHFNDLHCQSMDRKLTIREKLIYLTHYLMCSICRRVSKQLNSVRLLVRHNVEKNQAHQPDPEFMQVLRDNLKAIANSSQPPDQNP